MLAEYIDHMGDDLRIVNAARVSFKKESAYQIVPGHKSMPDNHNLPRGDVGLLMFLARGCSQDDWNALMQRIVACTDFDDAQQIAKELRQMPTHWTPFAHAMVTMRETVPIFVARQRFKHQIGFVYNEVSRRYVDDSPEFLQPEVWRNRPEASIKQGSGDGVVEMVTIDGFQDSPQVWYDDHCERSREMYEAMIADGIAPEQARMVLPQSMMTSYYVTGSLAAWARAAIQRLNPHAQDEIRVLAKQWCEIIEPLFPWSWSALLDE